MPNIGKRLQYILARNGTLVGFVLLVVLFTIVNPNFLSWRNAINVGQAVSELGVISVPLGLLLISGVVDLSVGSVASLAGVIGGQVMIASGSTALGILAGLGVGLLAGVINGGLVCYANLNSIVVTLGTLSIWGGLALYVTGGQTISGLPDDFNRLAEITVFHIPLQIFVLVAVIIYGAVVLSRLPYGRRLYAVGGNPRAAFLMGVPVKGVRFLMFVQVGVAAAVGGLMLTSELNAATPISGQGLELSSLTVVLLGGVAFAGGTGRVSGVIAGLFFVGVLHDGLVITGTSQFLQQVFLGVALVAAIGIDDTIRQFAHQVWTNDTADAGMASTARQPELTSSD